MQPHLHLGQWFSTRVILTLRGHLAISGHIFGPGVLLNIIGPTRQLPLQQRIIEYKMSIASRLRNPGLEVETENHFRIRFLLLRGNSVELPHLVT